MANTARRGWLAPVGALMRQVRQHRLWTLALAALVAAGCLGTLHRDRAAQALTLAPRETIGLPLHEDRPHWLLRSEPGWEAAHRARFGGDAADPARTVVRAARFRDETAAAQAEARITPAYAFRVWHRLMAAEPVLEQDVLPDGTPMHVLRYRPRPAPDEPVADEGQFTIIRIDRIVYVVESIAVPPERLAQVLSDLVAAAQSSER